MRKNPSKKQPENYRKENEIQPHPPPPPQHLPERIRLFADLWVDGGGKEGDTKIRKIIFNKISKI